MGALVKARIWIRETFEEKSRPTIAQVMSWIDSSEIPGRIIGGEPYVDADRFAVQHRPGQPQPSGADLLE